GVARPHFNFSVAKFGPVSHFSGSGGLQIVFKIKSWVTKKFIEHQQMTEGVRVKCRRSWSYRRECYIVLNNFISFGYNSYERKIVSCSKFPHISQTFFSGSLSLFGRGRGRVYLIYIFIPYII